MHVTGFIRGWPPAGYDEQNDADMSGNNCAMSNYSLVAVARLQVREFSYYRKFSVKNGVFFDRSVA